MSLIVDDLAAAVRGAKRELKNRIPDVKKTFAEVEDLVRREVDGIVDARENGRTVIPCLEFDGGALGNGARLRPGGHQAARRGDRAPGVLARAGGGLERGDRRVPGPEPLPRSSRPIPPSTATSASSSRAGRRSSASTGRSRRSRPGSIPRWRRPAPSSTGCGATGAKARCTSIPTGNAPMPIGSAVASPATGPSACLRTWTPARSSAGSTPATGGSTATCSLATGAPTSPSTALFGPPPRRSRRQRSAACSGPTRAGRR